MMIGMASTSERISASAFGGLHVSISAGGRQASSSSMIPRLQRKHARLQGCRMAAAAVLAIPEALLPITSPAQRPDAAGRFGRFGGKYVPETLIAALAKLEEDYRAAQADPAFQASDDTIVHSQTTTQGSTCATSLWCTNLDRAGLCLSS